jgi:ABC-2 type transport system ATP-binding protein
LVFLDELTTGLDPQARHAIWDLIRDVRGQGKTIYLTTHFMEEAEHLCDRVTVLDHGRIVALDTPANLIRNLGAEERSVFSVDRPLPNGFEKAISGEVRLEVQKDRVIVHGKNHRQVPLVSEVVGLLSSQGVPFHDLRTEQPNLEDVFLSLTGHEMRE